VGTSPLTNRIYAGPVLKDGRTWGAGSQDVTGDAVIAVADHIIAAGRPAVVKVNGVPRWEITVREISPPNTQPSDGQTQ
jgi:hypothetical protein